jgi:hypothetical protein
MDVEIYPEPFATKRTRRFQRALWLKKPENPLRK